MAFKTKMTIEYARAFLRRLHANPNELHLVIVDEGHVPRMVMLRAATVNWEAKHWEHVVGRYKYSPDLTAESIAEAIDEVDSYTPKWARTPPQNRIRA